ncbi:MAG: DUF5643 domain-containing protein [Paenibacillus macerans]|uniref:DUF5643 domain-containing protein n=1 Tax=Paenibacillus macerans TaxID=44252 RepID=A0A090ZWJ5_PAEMA|nr:DUF5643 domain-containing protein [Paenibacillus macerans]KFN08506.1 hypothetical protein DJ90_5078 [Paenibacillus macerans]MBS5911461.1 hypothetical protein [Paenibacillus macerans]MCY7561339.1 DUF5643 domain-containing protein [Paenibacillus macerans]MDU5947157.1 DUF5643 domain-containing protein [Paenibacillus macerans]MDU7474942.1 DUF5643 domain-containing protein [Paenibacillus macerans]
MKNTYKVMSSAALAGALLFGTAWGAAEAAGPMAAANSTAKSGGTLSAAKAKAPSVTQQGITLEISQAIYDGNYVGITLKRSGEGLTGEITGKYDEKTGEDIYEKGAIKDLDLFIDGKPAHEYGGGKSMAQKTQITQGKGSTKDMFDIRMADPSWIGGNLKAFPDKFKLTAKVTLEGVDKPYTLDMTLQKTKGKALKPNLTKKSGKLNVSLGKLNLTSSSSRIQLIIKGLEKGKPSPINYELVDDQGKELKKIFGHGSDDNDNNGVIYYDFVTDALSKNAKSITVKAYQYELEPNGTAKEDSNGETIKNYIKDLEMTVKVK